MLPMAAGTPLLRGLLRMLFHVASLYYTFLRRLVIVGRFEDVGEDIYGQDVVQYTKGKQQCKVQRDSTEGSSTTRQCSRSRKHVVK